MDLLEFIINTLIILIFIKGLLSDFTNINIPLVILDIIRGVIFVVQGQYIGAVFCAIAAALLLYDFIWGKVTVEYNNMYIGCFCYKEKLNNKVQGNMDNELFMREYLDTVTKITKVEVALANYKVFKYFKLKKEFETLRGEVNKFM
ncbi:hypothetical protein D3C81_11470 [compost metagenome]